MPNRIIKETIRTSKSVNSLSDFQFRLWMYLITYVDDYGCGSADPELLKGLVFPRRKGVTEAQIRDALTALANTGMVILYESDGEPYFYFPNWSEHQRVQSKKRKFPEPPPFTVSHGESREVTVSHGESPLESNPIQSESNPNPNTNTNRADKPPRARFTPPTVEEVSAYCRERSNGIDAQHFLDYYEARDWMLGKSKMKDWRAAVRTWEQRSDKKGGSMIMATTEDDVARQADHYGFSDDDLNGILDRMKKRTGA